MSVDIATLGLKIDATQVTQASGELDKLTAAAGRTEAATTKLTGSASKTAAEYNRQTAAMQTSVSAAHQASTAIDRNSKAYLDLDRQLERYIATIDKTYAAQRNLDKGHDLLTEGLRKGVISQAQFESGLTSLTAKYGPATEGAKNLGHGATGARIPMGLLTREVRALGNELASGRYTQFQGTLALLTSRFLAMGPATLVGTAAVIGLGVALYKIIEAHEKMAEAVKSIEVGFKAVGNSALLSSQEIRNYIHDLSLLPGVSKDSAEKAVSELSRVPYMTKPLFEQSTRMLGDFAAMLGKDVPHAAQTLAKAIEDPLHSFDALDKQFNILTLSQRLLIDDYKSHGDAASALAVEMQALEDRSRGLEAAGMTPLKTATNEVSRAWDELTKAFSDPTGTNAAANGIANLLSRFASLVTFVKDHAADLKMALIGAAGPMGLVASAAFSAATAPRDRAGASGDWEGARDTATNAPATQQGGMSQDIRVLLDKYKNVSDKADKTKELIADREKINALLKDEVHFTGTVEEKQAEKNRLLKIEASLTERINSLQKVAKHGGAKIEPLDTREDNARLNDLMKVYALESTAEKNVLSERSKYVDFYHSHGLTSDKDYYAAKIAINNDYLTAEKAIFEKEIAAVQAHEDELKKKRPQSKSQQIQVNADILVDETKLKTLREQILELTNKIGAANQFIGVQSDVLAKEKEFAAAVAKVAEIKTGLTETETRLNLEVQLGIKTQFEAIQATASARSEALAKMQDELALLRKIRDESAADPMSKRYIDSSKAIEKVNIELLKMQAALDPIGQKINGIVDSGLATFFDKLGSGGVRTFKDLKSAAFSFFADIDKQILHIVNQNLADMLMKSLGFGKGGATGNAGGVGGWLSDLFGFSGNKGGATDKASASKDSTDATGDFIKSLDTADGKMKQLSSGGLTGMIKSTGQWIEKLLFGTAVEGTATSATSRTTASMITLATAADRAATALASVSAGGGGGSGGIGGIAGLFGGVSDVGPTGASFATDFASGVIPMHTGGIVGVDGGPARMVPMSMFDGASRMHTGGLLGYGERPVIMKEGEEVLTDSDPRHRKNGGRSRGSVVQNISFNVANGGKLSQESQQQIAQRLGGVSQRVMAMNN